MDGSVWRLRPWIPAFAEMTGLGVWAFNMDARFRGDDGTAINCQTMSLDYRLRGNDGLEVRATFGLGMQLLHSAIGSRFLQVGLS